MFAFVFLGACIAASGAEKVETMREDGEFIPSDPTTDFDRDDGRLNPTNALNALVSSWRQKAGVMMSEDSAVDDEAPGGPHDGTVAVSPGHPGYSADRLGARGPCPTGNFKVWALRKGCPCGGAIQDSFGRRTTAEHQAMLDKVRRRAPMRRRDWNGDPGASGNAPHPDADAFAQPADPFSQDSCWSHICKPQDECTKPPLNGYDPCKNIAEGGACQVCQAGDADCFDHTMATYSGSYASGPQYQTQCVKQWAVNQQPNHTFGGRPSNFHAAKPEAKVCMMIPDMSVVAQPAFFHDPCKDANGAWKDFNSQCTICHPGDPDCAEPEPTIAKSCQLHGWNGALACKKVVCDLCQASITMNYQFPDAFEFTRAADYPNYPGNHGISTRFDALAKTRAQAWQDLMATNGSAGNDALKTWLDGTTGLHLNSGACTKKAGASSNCTVANPTIKGTCEGDSNCEWKSAINVGSCMFQGTQCSHCSAESVWTAHERVQPDVSNVYCGSGTKTAYYKTKTGAHYYDDAVTLSGGGSAALDR